MYVYIHKECLQCGSYKRPAGGAICSIACQRNDYNKTNKKIKRAARTLPDVFDWVTLPTIETCDIATAQSLQYVSPDAALELPNPICDHT